MTEDVKGIVDQVCHRHYADRLLVLLEEERAKFGNANKELMQAFVDALIEYGEYPSELTPVMVKQGITHLEMVEGYGAEWHRWREPLECPHCATDLCARESGPPFKREIGIYSRELDRTTGFKCPDCDEMVSER